MLKLLVVVAVIATAVADLETEWAVFKAKYNKKYNPEIENIRKHIWSENKRIIEEHNEKFKLGLSSYYLGENEYADMTNSEFVSRMNGLKVEQKNMAVNGKVLQVNDIPLSDSVDWRTKGYVTPVKNQGLCKCGWAFSATGAVEGQNFKDAHKLISLSESNLVDCSQDYGNRGCLFGSMGNAFMYVTLTGIESEANYPYIPKENACKFDPINIAVIGGGYSNIPNNTEPSLQQAVAQIGPISAGIDASHLSFMLYKGGVYNEPKCSSIDHDHGVLVVGYGTTNQSDDYWIVKNSWGTSWGEKGYIRMSRNKDNQCGIATMASYPFIRKSD